MALSDALRRLKSDFKLLESEGGSNANVPSGAVDDAHASQEKDVIDKLDRSVKFDEVDTVTFGLETDDGKIVKVYVNAEQAEDFEKALAAKLGEVDDIEECLNELAKEYEIVDVEWPTEEDDDKSDADTDSKSDGSSALDQRVYGKENGAQEMEDNSVDRFESLSVGEEFSLSLMESTNSIESRFTTASQLMVYHAIIELGIPEIALARNPYRASIIKGIKEVGNEVQRSASMKIALKTFIKRSVDFEQKATANKATHDAVTKGEHSHHEAPKGEHSPNAVITKEAMISELKADWSFSTVDDVFKVACDSLKASFNPEETEKIVKGITNHDAVVARDDEDPTRKIIFSPRGSNVLVKQIGTDEGVMMTSKDVDEMLSAISPETKPEEDGSK